MPLGDGRFVEHKGRAVSSPSQRVLLFVLLAAASLPLGCENRTVNPVDASWKKIEVEYCVGEPPVVAMASWGTEDPRLLAELREALVIASRQGLTLVPTMTTNRIALTLADGSDVVLHIYDEERLSYYNPADRQESYSIVTNKGFVEKLRNTIQTTTGESIQFYYDREVTISRRRRTEAEGSE